MAIHYYLTIDAYLMYYLLYQTIELPCHFTHSLLTLPSSSLREACTSYRGRAEDVRVLSAQSQKVTRVT